MYQSSLPVLALDCGNKLGECPVWDDREGVLWWTNIHDAELWRWDPFSQASPRVLKTGRRVGAFGLREGEGLVLAFDSGFALMDIGSGKTKLLAEVEPELPATRLNDGRVDPAGRFVCGGMDEGEPQRPLSGVYVLDRERSIKRILTNVSCANSLCWSGDGRTLYFADMPTRKIEAFDYDADGQLSNRRLFASLADEPGLADGSIVDEEDHLWNAQWGAGKIVRYAPDGKIEREIRLPVTNPTCMTFGGPDLDILFITTAWFGLSQQRLRREPRAGAVFAVRPGVKGRREHRWIG